MSTDIRTPRRTAALLLALLPFAASCFEALAADGPTLLPRVAVFTTGGTIQSKGDHRQKLMEYNAGRVAPDELVGDLPELAEPRAARGDRDRQHRQRRHDDGASAQARQERQRGARGRGHQRRRRHTRHRHPRRDGVFSEPDGASVKPVVVVGAMRPFTAVSRDGPFNLYNAVRVAALPEAAGYGVMILLNDTINAARDTTKSNTYRVDTFVARDVGPLGFADSDRVAFYRKPLYRHTAASEFDVSNLDSLPRVDITYGYQEADGTAIDAFVGGRRAKASC